MLLIVLIILVALGLWFIMGKKDADTNIPTDVSQVSQTPPQIQGTNSTTTTTVNPVENTTTPPAEKQYAGQGIRFSYTASATTWLSSAGSLTKTNVGTGINDPYLESIVYSEVPFSGTNYTKLAPVTYGSNTFDVYQAQESGTRVYVLASGRGMIIVTVPFRAGGNETTKYIDLASVSFN